MKATVTNADIKSISNQCSSEITISAVRWQHFSENCLLRTYLNSFSLITDISDSDNYMIKGHLYLVCFRVLKQILSYGLEMFGGDHSLQTAAEISQLRPASELYMSKVKSTLKQIVRDWSAEGEPAWN